MHPNTASRYIRIVWKIWRKQYSDSREKHSSFAVAQRNQMLRDAWAEKDWAAAARIAADRDKILGVMDPQPSEELNRKLTAFLGMLVGVLHDQLADEPALRRKVLEAVKRRAGTYEVELNPYREDREPIPDDLKPA